MVNNILSFISGKKHYGMEYDPKIVKIDMIYDIEENDLFNHKIVVSKGCSEEHREPKMGWPLYQRLIQLGYSNPEIIILHKDRTFWPVFEIMES